MRVFFFSKKKSTLNGLFVKKKKKSCCQSGTFLKILSRAPQIQLTSLIIVYLIIFLMVN